MRRLQAPLLVVLLCCCLSRANRVYVHPFYLFAADNVSCETLKNQMSKPLETLPVSPLDSEVLTPDNRDPSKVNRQNITERTAFLAELLNPLGLRMYLALSKMQSSKNTLFSPVNTCESLFSFYLGASKTTASFFLSLLGLSDIVREECLSIVDGHKVLGTLQNIHSFSGPEEKITTQVWAFARKDAQLSRDFIQGTQDFSDSSFIRGVDFSNPQEAETLVNSFVEKTSDGNLRNVFGDLNPSSNILFLSSFNFQGKWKTAFQPEKTSLQEFYLNATTTVMTPMMTRTGRYHYLNDKLKRCTVLKLPLTKQAYMLLVLPHEGVNLNNIETEGNLHMNVFSAWHQNLQEGPLELSLPKLSTSSVNDLNDLLTNMSPEIEAKLLGSEAEFSQLSNITPFSIDKAVNTVRLDLSEEGAEPEDEKEAADVPLRLSFNRPFFFSVIEGYNNAILLLGRITNPSF
ncbi:angiotensinogen [Oryzias melastigma]|uniref:Angiotensinogen n=1 Tax=Oryzias melastigma TaxID=30732 RepID=A0A3B3E033_ORYME|nr:angiotensinogen [Oryzias melastigma]